MQLQEYTYNRVRYTVDYRLSQFRNVKHNGITFIEFSDDLGDRILCKMIKDGVLDYSHANL